MILDANDSFLCEHCHKGNRLHLVLVPASRRVEFEESELANVLTEQTERFFFYTDDRVTQ